MREARYAVYHAPAAGSALAGLAAGWLGRDADTGADLAQPAVPGMAPERLAALTQSPRHYGFHATLKPPFRLAPGQTPEALAAAVEALAATLGPVTLPRLQVSRLSYFLALTPTAPLPEVQALAAASVSRLDGFRAPPGEAEIARRRPARLTPAQQHNLKRWGYPYVMEDFRFHMTLTGRIDDADAERLTGYLRELFADELARPHTIEALSLFEQPRADAPFRRTAAFPLRGQAAQDESHAA